MPTHQLVTILILQTDQSVGYGVVVGELCNRLFVTSV